MDQAVDCFISWRRCAGGHGQAGLSKRYKANARGSKARSCPLGIVATRGYSSWLRRKKDRSPAVGSSARRFSISRTELSALQSRGRMAIRAGVSFDREESSAVPAPRFREFGEKLSGRDANDGREGPLLAQLRE